MLSSWLFNFNNRKYEVGTWYPPNTEQKRNKNDVIFVCCTNTKLYGEFCITDDRLNFYKYISALCRKASNRLNAIGKIQH